MKFKRINNSDGSLYGWKFYCPGCAQYDAPDHGRLHQVHVVTTGWTFNGDVDKPTLSPSVLVTGGFWEDGTNIEVRCHSFVREGRIEFLSDCSHKLAGMTVELPEIE